jgi:hypothetical protein
VDKGDSCQGGLAVQSHARDSEAEAVEV